MENQHSIVTEVTAVLLAGGKSRRMGEDKRFLSVGEKTLFDRSLAVLRAVFRNVMVVIAQDSPALQADVPVLRDLVPDCGSLGGLYTGLKQAATPSVFAIACDMPFLDEATVRYFIELKGDADVVMAKLDNGWQPMHALYHQRCLPVMESLIKARTLQIHQLATHPSLRVRVVTPADLSAIDPLGRSFYNVNTPADLAEAKVIGHKAEESPP